MAKKGAAAHDTLYDELMSVFIALQRDFLKIHAHTEFGELSRLHMGVLGLLSRNGGLPISVVAARMFVSRPQMTVVLDRLEKLGLVRRGSDPRDRRVTVVTATTKGIGCLEKTMQTAHRQISERLSALSPQEVQEFGDALRALQRLLARL
jgi:DNA-binding MarR family transcriptional regulator